MRKLELAFVLGSFAAAACAGDVDDNHGSGGAAGTVGAGEAGGTVSSGGSHAGAPSGGRANGGSGGSDGGAQAGGEGGSNDARGGASFGGGVSEAGSSGDGGSSGAPAAGGRASGHGGAINGPGGAGNGPGGAPGQCADALPIRCGDRVSHSTITQGRAHAWGTYSATQRAESGRETVYAFESDGDCSVVATLANLTEDLDLLLLSTCDPISNTKASSTPLDLRLSETVSWSHVAGTTSYLVVDGYAGAEGSYLLAVACSCK